MVDKTIIKIRSVKTTLPTFVGGVVNGKKKIRIAKDGAKGLYFWKEGGAKFSTATPNDEGLATIANPAVFSQRDVIVGIDIDLPARLADRILGLAELKNSQSDKVTGGDEQADNATHFWVELREIEYDKTKGIVDANRRIVITDSSDTTTVSGKITLTGNHSNDAKKILIINPSNLTGVSATDKANPVVYAVEGSVNFDSARDALLALEDKIDEMEAHYTKDEGSLSRDIDSDLNFLAGYNGDATTSVQQKVYAVDRYKNAVDLWKKRLNEWKVWKKLGANTINDILRANANGFIIALRENATNAGGTLQLIGDGNLAWQNGVNDETHGNIKDVFDVLRGCKYRAFPIFDKEEQKTINVNNGATEQDKNVREFVVTGTGGRVLNASGIYNRANIDNFKASNASDKYFGHDKYKSISDPKKLRGFKPGDIRALGKLTSADIGDFDYGNEAEKVQVAKGYDGKGDVSGGYEDKGYNFSNISKRCFIIIRNGINNATTPENNLDNIIKEAFTGNDFEEVDGKTRLQHLEMYYHVVRSTRMTHLFYHGGNGYGYDEGKKRKVGVNSPASGSEDEAIIKQFDKLEAAYAYAKKFIEDVFVNRPKNLGEFTAWEEKVVKYGKGGDGKEWEKWLAGFWKDNSKTLDDIAREVRKGLSGDKGGDKWSKDDELQAAKKDATGDAKKVYDAFEQENDDAKKNDDVWKVLKGLVDKLKGTVDNPEELENSYKNGNEKIAWDFVNSNTEDNGKGWADRVVATAKTNLANAINSAKTEMNGEGDAVAKTGIESVKSISLANEIKNLFKLCKDAHGTPSTTEKTKLKADIEKHRGKPQWNNVNAYKKTGSQKGYVEAALDKIADSKKEDKKIRAELTKQSTTQGVLDKANEMGVKDKDLIRSAQIAVKYKSSNDSEKKLLSEIFSKDSDEYSSDKDKVGKSIEEIEKHIKLLEKIANATDETSSEGKIKKELGQIEEFGDVKEFLTKWKGALEARKQELEKVKKEKENNNDNNTENPSWYKTWYGILGIIAGIVLVLGVIVYFVKSNSSEEGEEESE